MEILKNFFLLVLMVTLAGPALAQEKSHEEESLQRRQKVELLSFFLKDPKDATLPKTPQAIQLFNQAVESFEKNDLVLARQSLNESLKLNQDNALAYELLGDVDYQEQKLKDAKANYEIAYNLEPRDTLKQKLEKIGTEAKVETRLATYEEQHFIIKYNREASQDKGFELRELLRNAYRNISQDFGYYFDYQVPVILYNEEDFKTITQQPHWVAGLYDGKVRMPMNGHGFTDPRELAALTAHEVTHAFVAGMSARKAPPWINEGLAEYEENKIRPNDTIIFQSAIKTHTLLPLVQMMNEQTVNSLNDPLLIGLFYEEVFQLVSYMVERYGMFRVKQILGEFGKGKNSEEALQAVLKISSERLEQEWKATFTN